MVFFLNVKRKILAINFLFAIKNILRLRKIANLKFIDNPNQEK